MNITEDYVSFEIARLLKEKGFKGRVNAWHNIYDKTNLDFRIAIDAPHLQIPAPTLQMAIKWLREEHNIMISPYALSLGWYFEIFDLNNRDITGCKPLYKVCIPNKQNVLNNYEEACEAGIKYCLENLI